MISTLSLSMNELVSFEFFEGITRWHLESSELTVQSAKKASQPELFPIKLHSTVWAVNLINNDK